METLIKTAKIKKYPAYKNSGVEWIGEIPEHWEILRIKYLFKEINERSSDGNEELLSVSQYTGVTKKSDKVQEGSLLTNALTLEGYKKVSQGDLVSNIMLAWNGSLGFSDFNGITSPAYAIYRLNNRGNKRFFHYLLRTDRYKAEFKRNSSGVIESRLRLYSDDFFRILSLLPPLSEQTAIANFLDQKTQDLDTAISQKQNLIKLLEERKQIIIQDAVTKGINKNVELKESGIEWIGKIPKHWEVKKLKHLTKIFRGKFTHRPRNDERFYDGKYPFFQTGDVARANKYLSNFSQTLNERGLKVSTLIPKGTIVITIAANIGDIAILEIDACFPDSIVGFEPNKLIRDYLYYALLIMKQQFINSTTKNTQMNLNIESVGNNKVSYPSFSEQQQIVSHIESESKKIDTAISLQKKQIKKLKEYKSVLIDAAVTGKIQIVND
ncbi:restriction endonuclease S subunit [Bernardetia litoralis DSM 6794]|uniref:Restriction endonuclease S subunit n=1 Tax=Bernardetia litoralis (strain ATCC 23117 / DSM 6794 / NBRC 15988 / NCIMB 1366 / Fx l1 / Sio-4) TaxID=880071 RepID=I4AFD7_BERLS|nr:restriction endonuclease subunit S [Bernardetia litoralis]AFM02672.1 restriction endonuclease S subunit [Bernardetia litoralis DSM 6794]